MKAAQKAFIWVVMIVGLAHPVIHQFELGSLDVILDYLNIIAANFANNLTLLDS